MIKTSYIVYIILSFAAFVPVLTNRIHMFQLNAYKYIFHKDWMKSNRKTLGMKAVLPLISLVVCLIPGDLFVYIACIPNIIFLLINLPKKAKKPLVFTARVKRLYATSVILFAILAAFSVVVANIYPVFLCQFALIITSYVMLFANILNRPGENAIRRKYINEAKKKIASLPNLTVIGITGSYGKTGTKYILEKLLSEKYNVLMTPASYNTTMGVVKVIRENLTAAHDIFICEMGARNTGEIKEICDIVKPKYGIITSIGPCHLETFGSIENIIKTKFELCDALPDDGIIFLNADNEHIAGKTDVSKSAVYYGIQNENADFCAQITSVSESGTRFEVLHENEHFSLSSKLLGEHSVVNILGCVAVARALGVSPDQLTLGSRRIEGAPHRLSLIKGNGFVIIDDSFNSNPSGCKAALKVLSQFEGQKILITPGMIELGEKQNELNFEFGKNAAAVCDKIFLVGEKQTKPIKSGALDAGFDEKHISVFERVEDAINNAKILPTSERNVILIENDLPDNF